MTTGLNRHTGATLSGAEHIAQSVNVILTTTIGSRPYRREFGSRLPLLLGRPQNAETKADMVAATAEALARWEPRITIARVEPKFSSSGHVLIDLYDTDGNLIEVRL